jgi:cell division protein ZapB
MIPIQARVAYAGTPQIPPMEKADFSKLEGRVNDLIKLCDDLRVENQAMRSQQSNLMAERASLIEKSELARTRVEAMIARLKAMEVST